MTRIYNNTTVINNYTYVNNTYVNHGFQASRVSAATGVSPKPLPLREAPAGWKPGPR